MSTDKREWHWIAVNGSSVAACFAPSVSVSLSPRPEILIGLPTREEQLETQAFLLNAPREDALARLQELAALKNTGVAELWIITNPEPQTDGDTYWELGD